MTADCADRPEKEAGMDWSSERGYRPEQEAVSVRGDSFGVRVREDTKPIFALCGGPLRTSRVGRHFKSNLACKVRSSFVKVSNFRIRSGVVPACAASVRPLWLVFLKGHYCAKS